MTNVLGIALFLAQMPLSEPVGPCILNDEARAVVLLAAEIQYDPEIRGDKGIFIAHLTFACAIVELEVDDERQVKGYFVRRSIPPRLFDRSAIRAARRLVPVGSKLSERGLPKLMYFEWNRDSPASVSPE